MEVSDKMIEVGGGGGGMLNCNGMIGTLAWPPEGK